MKASNTPEHRFSDEILARRRPNSIVCLLCLGIIAALLIRTDDDEDEIVLPSIVDTSNSSISSFPHWAESSDWGGSRIVYELYRFWDEDLEVVSPQPFSYLLYADGSNADTGIRGCGCHCSDNRCPKTLGEALECCAASKEGQELLPFISGYYSIDSESETYLSYGWHPVPCQDVHHHSTPRETDISWANENIPFADGQLYGNATELSVYIADPTSDSCWSFGCGYLYLTEDSPETCVGLLQKNLRLVSLEEFVGAIKDRVSD